MFLLLSRNELMNAEVPPGNANEDSIISRIGLVIYYTCVSHEENDTLMAYQSVYFKFVEKKVVF